MKNRNHEITMQINSNDMDVQIMCIHKVLYDRWLSKGGEVKMWSCLLQLHYELIDCPDDIWKSIYEDLDELTKRYRASKRASA